MKFLSVKRSVIAPAKTGKDNTNKKAVIKTAQTKRGSLYINKPLHLKKKIVQIKFIEPAIEDIPAKCKLKIAKSIEAPEWPFIELNGGYATQEQPAPLSTRLEINNKSKDGGKSQKLRLFNRAKAISVEPIKIGTNQFA